MRCDQACPYNTLNGCKVNEYNGICPLTNMAAQKKPMTNADRIRAMSDEELAEWHETCPYIDEECTMKGCVDCVLEWLQQPVKED